MHGTGYHGYIDKDMKLRDPLYSFHQNTLDQLYGYHKEKQFLTALPVHMQIDLTHITLLYTTIDITIIITVTTNTIPLS